MKICPWCEGKGVTGLLVHGEDSETITVCGVKIPIIGEMHDICCKFCKGVGIVRSDQTQAERWAEIRSQRSVALPGKEGES